MFEIFFDVVFEEAATGGGLLKKGVLKNFAELIRNLLGQESFLGIRPL